MRSPSTSAASIDAVTDSLSTLGGSVAASDDIASLHSSSAATSYVQPAGSSCAATSSSHSHHSNSNANSRRRSSHGGYVSRVSFDDTNASGRGGGTGFDQSYTLRATTSGFVRTRESRTFLVATDLNAYSMHALNWCIDSLIEDGDELVVLRVLDPSTSSVSLTRSSLSELAKEEASSLMKTVAERNSTYSQTYESQDSIAHRHDNITHSHDDNYNGGDDDDDGSEAITEIGITIEHVVGKVQESIQKVIKVYLPDSLIVGTRGRSDSLLKSAFIGSVSRFCVAECAVPVVVVRPAVKVRKTVDKREGRQTYKDLVEGPSRPGSSAGNEGRVSTGIGMPRSNTLPTGRGTEPGWSGKPTSRNSSPTRTKSSGGTLGKISNPLTKTKTLS